MNMLLMLLKRRNAVASSVVSSFVCSRFCSFCTGDSKIVDKDHETAQVLVSQSTSVTSSDYSSRLHLSPLFSSERLHTGRYDIELVDPDTWRVSSGLVEAWRGAYGALERRSASEEDIDDAANCCTRCEDDPDFDEIEDMRIHGHLFYKLDRDSKEFEEYNFNFHRKKSLRNKNKENLNCNVASGSERSVKNKDKREDRTKKKGSDQNLSSSSEEIPKFVKSRSSSLFNETGSSYVGEKKLRTPTFNQLTAPYHEPFCLDIFISKSSIRACIIHRVTSKVVAVAHSISKDMKFDLASPKDSTACAAVGAVLSQRALADDIHDVVYTPRKGEKLEGKLQTVLRSIIDNGVNVKVKIKQRKAKKAVDFLAV
ncbi:uncharacterized protein LOC131149269 [Malania oleifera]|uniref:uncharacterized protein LOC131149269 n=1 Tax=Malania oleifera TaxID=397392 RepID=UPI0025ADE113|nr:uncharacterized protein LOC131149269 [Malania oleifera]XP_057955556.1 uncharacterized protein LOC131149269 [Malania oleifera]XP_057955557.1 uncharacterized protein LOC131149269 [Malania oleifera]XP_057955558.1 uncharacterized protein LOC131149269 [Malania oleifera]